MLPFKLVYSDDYFLPIGSHVFPGEKYKRVHDRLLKSGVADEADFMAPQSAEDDDILLVHTARYVEKLLTGTLSAREELEMEIPYSLERRTRILLVRWRLHTRRRARPPRRSLHQHWRRLPPCVSRPR